MLPEEVRERWLAKMEALGTEPSLPHPSVVALTLAGMGRDAEVADAIDLLIHLYGDEVPIDGGPAKCRKLDSEFYDAHVKRTGQLPRGLRVMEAAWLASDEALYYVSPHVGKFRRFPWGEIELQPSKRRAMFGKVIRLRTSEDEFKLGLSASAMANLLVIHAWRSGLEPET